MTDQTIRELVDQLLAISPECADRDELGVAVGLNAKLKAFTVRYDMRCSRRGDALAAAGTSESGFAVLLDEGNGSGRDAKLAGDRDLVCRDLPGFDDALAAGAVSGEHLDVLAKHTRGLSDAERSDLIAVGDELVDTATSASVFGFERDVKNRVAAITARHRPDSDVEQLERQRAGSSITRWTEPATGMKMTLIGLDPIRDATFHNVINAQLARLRQDPVNKQRPFQQLKIEAVLAAVSATAGEIGVPEVVFHADAQTACSGRHAHTLCETQDGDPVPVATMQRFCCEAILTAVLVEADGTVRKLAEQRTANRHQRRALAAMYATCAHPHCQVAFSQCRIHHITWWTNGGQTILSNLLPVCETHHHLLHEGGWTITMTPTRDVTWIRPDGSVWMVHSSINRQPDQQQQRQRTQRQRRQRTPTARPDQADPTNSFSAGRVNRDSVAG